MVLNPIPNRLSEWRLKTRHSQREVGLIVGFSVASIVRHENGSRGLTHEAILRYAGLYKVPTYALFVHPAPTSNLPPDERARITNRLRELVHAAKLTSEEIFKLTGIPPATLHALMVDQAAMSHGEIIALAKVFKVPTYQLFVEPFGHDEGWFSDDEFANLVPLNEWTTGDPGTPYTVFSGGHRARADMATAV